jgi:hypothetical protein
MEKTDNVVALPILSMEAMDPKVCDADKLFEPAMSYRFPANPSSRVLSEARRQVLAYLNWITSDNGITSEGPDFAVDEIRRACARLIEIAELFPFVFDAEKERRGRNGREGRRHLIAADNSAKGSRPVAGDLCLHSFPIARRCS